jgi:hypothetical protein
LPRIDVDKSVCWNEGGYINCWTYQPVKLKNRNIVWFGYHARNDYVGWSGTKWIMYDYDENRFNQYGYLKDANGNPVYIYEVRRNSVDILNETEGMAIGRSVDPNNGAIIRPAVWLVRSQSIEIGAEETIGAPAPTFSVVFNYNLVDFGTVTPYTIAEAKSINYNVSITSASDYKVSASATDWSGPITIPANTLYFAVNDTLDKLSFETAKQLSNALQLIATFPYSVTTNYHAFYFAVPLVPPGTYTATINITYEVI